MSASDTALETRLRRATQAWLERARPLVNGFGRRLPEVQIRCDLRGATAGQAVRLGRAAWCIRYNPALAARHAVAFEHEVAAHEVAHVVATHCHGPGIRPHGTEWRSVMAFFGQPGAGRCHAFPVAEGERRRQRRWPYRCACTSHALSTTRHRRVAGGVAYRCRRCGTILRPDGGPPATG